MPNWNKHYVVDIAVLLALTFLTTIYSHPLLPTCHPERQAGFAGSYAEFVAVCRFRQCNAGVCFFDVLDDYIQPPAASNMSS